MVKRFETEAIETVAAWIAEGGLSYEEGDEMTALRRINESADGWTVDVPSPLGGVTRHEQVRLTDDGLRAALILGTQWRDRPLYATPPVLAMTVSEARAAAREAMDDERG